MALTPINSEDRLVQATFAEHLEKVLGWESVYAWNDETFGPGGTLGRKDTSEAVLTRDLRAALERLNLDLPPPAIDEAMRALTTHDFSRSMVQHNKWRAGLLSRCRWPPPQRPCARDRFRQQARSEPFPRCP
jgi:type I restriction enzyme, R subunit